jgi:PAS domain S-box-containing protein
MAESCVLCNGFGIIRRKSKRKLVFTSRELHLLSSAILVQIIEEISDGILILNQEREVLFFNEVLLKMTSWRSMDILTREKEFLSHFPLENGAYDGKKISLPDLSGGECQFVIHTSVFGSATGEYTIIGVKKDAVEEYDVYRQRYEQLFNNIGDAMLTINLEGNIITANSAFYQLTGWEADAAPRNIREYYVYRDDIEEKLIRLLENRSIFNLETHLYTSAGETRRVLDSSWGIRGEDGSVAGYATQLKDITYLKNIESRLMISERNFTFLFDTMLSAIIIVDPEGRIVNLNSTAENIYGYAWDEIVGEDFDSIFRVDRDCPTIFRTFQKIQLNNGRYMESEVKRKGKAGKIIYTFAAYSAVTDSREEIIAYSIVEKDLTERIKLETKLRDSIEEIKETQSAAILGFAKLTEYRDKDTGKHLERIREYTRLMAKTLRKLDKYTDYITDEYIEDLSLSSTLHDVGKVGIEDQILLKPGRLSAEEFERIKEHAGMGGDALGEVDDQVHRKSFLTIAREIAHYHHERWDGNGYPDGLAGSDIPLSARIVAIADVYDALTSKRPYKDEYSHEQALEIISNERGTQFDPDIVDAFIENHHVFQRIKVFIEFEENPQSINDLLEMSGLPLTDVDGETGKPE